MSILHQLQAGSRSCEGRTLPRRRCRDTPITEELTRLTEKTKRGGKIEGEDDEPTAAAVPQQPIEGKRQQAMLVALRLAPEKLQSSRCAPFNTAPSTLAFLSIGSVRFLSVYTWIGQEQPHYFNVAAELTIC
ncbi:hypothetical protein PROFUN_07812 [Planoprotostelium fungivorum]|uniref:Uncharacterized protein n=1 Tax=Planoprotostelium fungivorum TaxID=1890364 RepID=A0A2P6MX39_9EUKA|nr:hypothetical protein PROFUN_07812 [Planoprotostelium fungivorum]